MKYIKLTYPDNTEHNVLVKYYGYNEKLNKEFIYYYDLTNSKDMYTILKRIDNKIYKDPYDEDNSFEELITESIEKDMTQLPKDISSIKENKNIYQNQTVCEFEVYHDPTNNTYYANELVCNRFNVGTGSHIINGVNYRIIEPLDIATIKKESEKEEQKYEPIFLQIPLYKKLAQFIVYHNSKTNEYFTNKMICSSYNVGFGSYKIEGTECKKVTLEEVRYIEKESKKEEVSLEAKFIEMKLVNTQTKAIFIVYHDEYNNKYYVSKNICDKYRVGLGLINIYGETCREVTLDEISHIENQSKYENPALEAKYKSINLNILNTNDYKEKPKTQRQALFIVYHDVEPNEYYMSLNLCKKFNIGNGQYTINNETCCKISYEDIKRIEEITKYNDPCLKAKIIDIYLTKTIPFNVYVDTSNNRKYIDYTVSEKFQVGTGLYIINDKPCREVTDNDIKYIESKNINNKSYKAEYKYLDFKKEQPKEIYIKVYRDKINNNKLYLNKDDCRKYNIGNKNSFKYVNNVESYEVSLEEVSNLNGKTIDNSRLVVSILTIYLQKEVNNVKENTLDDKNKKTENNKFIKQPEEQDNTTQYVVATLNNNYYIDENLAELFGITFSKTITVNNSKFVLVSLDDLDFIEDITKNLETKLVRKYVNLNPYSYDDDKIDNKKFK